MGTGSGNRRLRRLGGGILLLGWAAVGAEPSTMKHLAFDIPLGVWRDPTPLEIREDGFLTACQACRNLVPVSLFPRFVRENLLSTPMYRLARPELTELIADPDWIADGVSPQCWQNASALFRGPADTGRGGIGHFTEHPRLRWLNLELFGNCNLAGAGRFARLEALNLNGCRVVGFHDNPIPGLRRLALYDTTAQGARPLGFSEGWSRLESLLLGGIWGGRNFDFDSLDRLPELKELAILDAAPKSWDFLARLPKLEKLYLNTGRVRLDLALLADRPLSVLSLAGNRVRLTGSPEPLYRMTRLKELAISLWSFETVDLEALSRLPLRRLALTGSPRRAFSAEEVLALSRLPLTHLTLVDCRLPNLPELLRRLPELEEFRCVRSLPPEADGLLEVLAAMPKLRALSLGESEARQPDGPGKPLDLSLLAGLRLTALDLYGIRRPFSLAWLRRVPTLRYLRLPPRITSLEPLAGMDFELLIAVGGIVDLPAECARTGIVRRQAWATPRPIPGVHPAWRKPPVRRRLPPPSRLSLPLMPRLPSVPAEYRLPVQRPPAKPAGAVTAAPGCNP